MAAKRAKRYKKIAVAYARAAVAGDIIVGAEVVAAAQRFLDDLERKDLTLRTKDADFVCNIVERIMVHKQGQTLDGTPLTNTPFKLLPWQVFIIYNLLGFYYKGRRERRYKEAFIYIPRKNGKTLFAAARAFGIGLLERRSGAKIYIVAASLKQACESFEDILYTIRYRGMVGEFKIRNNNAEHSIHCDFYDDDGIPCGFIHIEALASNPDAQDSFNAPVSIADEIQAFKRASQYNRFKEAGKAYTNKIILGVRVGGQRLDVDVAVRQAVFIGEIIVHRVLGVVVADSEFPGHPPVSDGIQYILEGFTRLFHAGGHDVDCDARPSLQQGDAKGQRRGKQGFPVFPRHVDERLFIPALPAALVVKTQQIVDDEHLPGQQSERCVGQRRTVQRLPLLVHHQALHDVADEIRVPRAQGQVLSLQIRKEAPRRGHDLGAHHDLPGDGGAGVGHGDLLVALRPFSQTSALPPAPIFCAASCSARRSSSGPPGSGPDRASRPARPGSDR